MKKQRTVYLAGKITGDPEYREKFSDAAIELEAAGYVVLNPAVLPEGFKYEAYMRMTAAMLDECEMVCFLADWIDSEGSMREYLRALDKGKRVFLFAWWKSFNDAGGKLA